jgi:hypothetical protein
VDSEIFIRIRKNDVPAKVIKLPFYKKWVKDWKIERLKDWKIERLKNWKIEKLKIVKLKDWKI